MKIAVVGLGGVGGFYGGKLARRFADKGEHEIFFIARGDHLKAIKEKGLTVTSDGETWTAHPAGASNDPSDYGPYDLVIVAVKGYGLPDAAHSIASSIHDNSIIIPLLNGVDSAEHLAGILPQATILNGCVYISSHIASPGAIEHVGGAGKLVFGPTHGDTTPYRHIEKIFTDAGITAHLSDTIERDVWTKFLFIGPLAGITAMREKTLGEIMNDEKDRTMLTGMMREVEAIARKRSIILPSDIVDTSLAMTANFPSETKTSLQLDVEKGREAEIDLFIGSVIRSGKALAIPTPLHDKVYSNLITKQELHRS